MSDALLIYSVFERKITYATTVMAAGHSGRTWERKQERVVDVCGKTQFVVVYDAR